LSFAGTGEFSAVDARVVQLFPIPKFTLNDRVDSGFLADTLEMSDLIAQGISPLDAPVGSSGAGNGLRGNDPLENGVRVVDSWL
jgi:hypothetical protein